MPVFSGKAPIGGTISSLPTGHAEKMGYRKSVSGKRTILSTSNSQKSSGIDGPLPLPAVLHTDTGFKLLSPATSRDHWALRSASEHNEASEFTQKRRKLQGGHGKVHTAALLPYSVSAHPQWKRGQH